jgi:hypothetical protein
LVEAEKPINTIDELTDYEIDNWFKGLEEKCYIDWLEENGLEHRL